MKMMFSMIFAMLLSTASARMLKSPSCDEDYQAPNYWGECINGEFRNIDRFWDDYTKINVDADCCFLVILVPQESVGNKTLTIKYKEMNGVVARNSTGSALQFNDFGYYSLILAQDDTVTAADTSVFIIFYLDNIPVHEGNYQQNFCFWEAGAITTNDPKAVTYEGSYGGDMPGHVIVTF